MVINPIVGVNIPVIRIPIKGGMTIPNIATFDHGTYGHPRRSLSITWIISLLYFIQQQNPVHDIQTEPMIWKHHDIWSIYVLFLGET